MKVILGLLMVVLASGVVWAEEEAAITPAEGLEHILEHYLPISKSLAGDSLKGVKEDAEHIAEMAGELSKIKCGASEEEQKKCQEMLSVIKSSAEKMNSDKIEDVRTAFGELSNALIECLTKCSAPEKEHYIFYCSMVKKHWIQDNKEVANPYYGSKMLKCGELKKTIGGKSEGEHKEGEGHHHSSKGACPFIKGETGAKEHVSGCCAM